MWRGGDGSASTVAAPFVWRLQLTNRDSVSTSRSSNRTRPYLGIRLADKHSCGRPRKLARKHRQPDERPKLSYRYSSRLLAVSGRRKRAPRCIMLTVRRRKGSVMQYQGIVGLLVLVADVWAIVNIFQSSVDTGKKFVWIITVILLPVIGLILWYFLGPRTGKA